MFITIPNAGNTSLRKPTISAEVVEKLIEPNADISMTDMLTAEATVVQEEILHGNKEIQSNAELECQYTFMSSKDKEAVQSVPFEETDTVHVENMGLLSPTFDMIPQILRTAQETDGQLITDSNQDTKDELKSFFRMLELPLVEIATNHTIAFSNSVSQLIANKVLPLSEHIRLEEFWSTLSENLTTVAICQKQTKEKRDTMDQFANVSKNLDAMGNNIQHLKAKLHQIDMEQAELVTRLGKLKEEKRSLLA
ncbi:hypothetical protein RHSIM_Rhsim11G0028400 [Rhododendron simsii]|uniref:Uncharacterized protein n=1 Tax=Rhododendron simsii TaxID=118357 RepID=A0A834G923_RHOSS|nr:hypothetical protein RHSIM_Rhsim11G0028400 [Rhododendron simsii]